MKTRPNPLSQLLRRDLLKIGCLALGFAAILSVFVAVPGLSTSVLISAVSSLLMSPLVEALERKGFSRSHAIFIVFGSIFVITGVTAFWTMQTLLTEWKGFSDSAPRYFQAALEKLRTVEGDWKQRLPFLAHVQATDSLMEWGEATGKWFIANGPALMGQIATCLLLVPLLTFGILNDGRTLKKMFFELVPNRFFESGFMISSRIMSSMSDYIRAKMIEALLVGAITTIGLALVHAPYAIVLGVLAGVTNIIPYIGPVIGAVPGIIIATFDQTGGGLLWQVTLVYAIANVVDMVLIFPLVVAKLVNLHPLVLVIVVLLGQQYYGLIGMLISIPVATGAKIILQEVYSAIYHHGASRLKLG